MQKAYIEKVKEIDTLVWKFCGEYILSAVNVAIDHNIRGKKAKSKYINKPITKEDNKPKINDENRTVIEKMNWEIRMKMLENEGLPLPPR